MQIHAKGRELIELLARLKREGRIAYGLTHKQNGVYVLNVGQQGEQQATFVEIAISDHFETKKSLPFEAGATLTSDALS